MLIDAAVMRKWLPWILLTLAVHTAAVVWIVIASGGIPFVFDGNETFSTLIHAENIFRFGVEKSFGLTDEAYGAGAAAHPYVYTHQGNFPRLFGLLIYALGARTAEAQVIVTTAIIGTAAIMLAFYFFARWINPVVAFIVCAIYMTDYVMMLQWHVVTFHVWHMFFVFAALLCVDGFSSARRRWAVAITFALYFCLFYYEIVFACFLAVAAGVYTLCVHADRPKDAKIAVLTQFSGAIAAAVFLIVQDAAYLGLSAFLHDASLTFIARNQAPDTNTFRQVLREFYDKHDIVFWYNVVDNTGARSLGGLTKALFDFCLSVYPPSLTVAAFLPFFGWMAGTIRHDHEKLGWSAFAAVWMVVLLLLLGLAPFHTSPPVPHILGRFSIKYVVGVAFIAFLALVAVRTLFGSPLGRKLSGWFIRWDTLARMVLLVLIAACVLMVMRIGFVFVTGIWAPISPLQFSILFAVPIVVALAAAVLCLSKRAFGYFALCLARPVFVRGLAGIGIASVFLFALSTLYFTRFVAAKVAIAALMGAAPFVLLSVRPQWLSNLAALRATPSQVVATRLAAIVGIGVAGLALVIINRHVSSTPVVLGRFSVSAAVFALMSVYSILLLGALFIWPVRMSGFVQRRPFATLIVVMVTAIGLLVGMLGGAWLNIKWGIVGAIADCIVVTIGGIAIVGVYRFDSRPLRQWIGQRLTPVVMSASASVGCYGSFLIFSFVVLNSSPAEFGGIGRTLPLGAILGLSLLSSLFAAAIIFRSYTRVVVKLRLAIALCFVAAIIWTQRENFNFGYLVIWKALLPTWLSIRLDQGLVIAAGLAAVWLATGKRSRSQTDNTQYGRLLWALSGGLIGFVVVLLLSPGYVLTGYLERYVPMLVFFIDAAIGVGLGSLLVAADVAFKNGISTRPAFPWRAIALAKGAAPIALVGIIATWWGYAQFTYVGIFPPDHFSFLKELRSSPYVGKTAVTNTYAAPIAAMTGTWAYNDPELPAAVVVENADGTASSFKSDMRTYVWFADKTDPKYRHPDLFVCMLPQNFGYALLRLSGVQQPTCDGTALVHRASLKTQYDAATVKLLDKDPRATNAWTILDVDWEMPPMLARLTSGHVSRVGIAITEIEDRRKKISLSYDVRAGATDSRSDSLVTLYSASKGCPAHVEDLTPIASGVNLQEFIVDSTRRSGVVVASVIPRVGDKRGWEYFSEPINLETHEACPLALNSLSAKVTGNREIMLEWNQASAASHYQVYMTHSMPAPAPAWAPWTYIATLPTSYEKFPILGIQPGLLYSFKLEPCNSDGCWLPSVATVDLPTQKDEIVR